LQQDYQAAAEHERNATFNGDYAAAARAAEEKENYKKALGW
jgi:hypothetical protein